MPKNLSLDELVAVNSLLIERETRLADLSRIEAALSDILGRPYPFPDPPVDLPSTRKRKRPKAGKKPKPKRPPKLRRLKDGEVGYRLTLLERGQSQVVDLVDIAPFQQLIAQPLPHQRIQKVETLDAAGTPADTLHHAE